MLRGPINMTPQDLLALNKYLQQAMEATARVNVEGWTPTSNERDTDIFPLAKAGAYAFKRTFSEPDVEMAIQSLVTRSEGVAIEVTSEDFFLLWELMYPVA